MIARISAGAIGTVLAVLAMVDYRSDGNLRRELRKSARVIFMKMSQEDEINLLDSGLPRCVYNAGSIPAVVAWPARINQQ